MVVQTNPPIGGNEMLSKTRTTIVTLVAAFSFAGASLVPTVAQAKLSGPRTGDDRGPAKQPPWVKQGPRISLAVQ
jgi:hypothetical protein